MQKNNRRMKVAALLASGAMMMQLGGCLFNDNFWRQVQIGFGRGVGTLPANIVNDFLNGFIGDLTGGGEGG